AAEPGAVGMAGAVPVAGRLAGGASEPERDRVHLQRDLRPAGVPAARHHDPGRRLHRGRGRQHRAVHRVREPPGLGPPDRRLRTLSSIIAEEGIERIDLLKVNVEKSELDVLRGLDPEDWPKIRQAVIEVDQHDHVEPITLLLERHGFEVLVEQDPLLRHTELCYVYAIRPSPEGGRLIRHQPPDAYARAELRTDGEVLTPASLRKYLQARLPQYMIPSA